MRGGGSQETWANFLNLDSQISRFSPDEVQLWLTSGIFRRGLGIKLSETSLVRSRLAETSDPTKTKLKNFFRPPLCRKTSESRSFGLPGAPMSVSEPLERGGDGGGPQPRCLILSIFVFPPFRVEAPSSDCRDETNGSSSNCSSNTSLFAYAAKVGQNCSVSIKQTCQKAFQGGINNSGSEDGEKERDNLF